MGPGTLGNVINRMRVRFKRASDNGLIDRPVRYGQGIRRPSKKTLRIDKAKKGAKLLTREAIHKLLGIGAHLKAMDLLGINFVEAHRAALGVCGSSAKCSWSRSASACRPLDSELAREIIVTGLTNTRRLPQPPTTATP